MTRTSLIAATTLALATCIGTIWHFHHQRAYSPRPEVGGRDAAGAAEYMRMIRSNVATGQIEPQDYIQMLKAAESKMATQQKSVGLNWVEMGPDNVGGRTRSITLDPSDQTGNTLYAGGVTGGLWKSTDGANTWTNVAGFSDNLCVSSIAFMGNGHLYVATGPEFDGGSGTGGSGSIGFGLYKSVDNASSFTLVQGPSSDWSTIDDWAYINKIATDPLNADGLWVGGHMGFKHYNETTDVFSVPNGISTTSNCRAIEVSTDGQVVVAGINAGTAFISINGGANFSQAQQSGANSLPSAGVGRMEFAISPDDHNYIYAMQSTGGGQMKGVWVSNNGGQGASWDNIWPPGSSVPSLDIFGDNGQGWYDNVIAVRPGTNSQEVWVGGVSLWKTTLSGAPQQIALAQDFPGCFFCVHADVHEVTFVNSNQVYVGCDGGIYKSYDAGFIWTAHNRHYNVTQFYSMAFSPKGKVLGGTQDNGTQYIETVAMTPQDAVEVAGGDGFDCEISQLSPNIMFSTVYNGALSRSQDNGINFSGFYDIRVQDLLDLNEGLGDFYTNIALVENYNDMNSPYTVDLDYEVPSDIPAGGSITIEYHGTIATVPQYYTYTNTGSSTITAGTIIPLTLPDRVTSILAIGFTGSEGLWVTRGAMSFSDSTQWWKVVDNVGNVNVLEFSEDGNHLFYGDGQTVYRVSNFSGAYTFDQADVSGTSFALTYGNSSAMGAFVTGLCSDPNDGNHLMVTLGQYGGSGKVRISNNALGSMGFGSVWNPGPGLTAMPVFDGIIHAGDPDILVVGTELGIMASDDGGDTWAFENTGLARVLTHAVRQQTMTWNTNPYGVDYVENQWVIYAGTHGRGFFRTETLLGVGPETGGLTGPGTLSVFPNPVSDAATLSFQLGAAGPVGIKVYDMNGRVVVEQRPVNMAPGTQRVTIDASALRTGAYIAEVSADGKRRTARFVVNR